MPPTPGSSFWDFNIGNAITLASMLIAFFLAHRSNVKRIEDNSARMANLETKLELVFKWFEANVIHRKLD